MKRNQLLFLIIITLIVRFSVTNVSASQLSVNPKSLDFGYTITSMTFSITNKSNDMLNWVAKENPSESWLLLDDKSNGSLKVGESTSIQVKIDRATLSKGIHYGQIMIASGSEVQFVDIIVRTGDPPVSPKLEVDRHVLDFNTSLDSLTFYIKNQGINLLSWSASKSKDKNWIVSISPASGSLSSMNETEVVVVVDRSRLSAGRYYGNIALNSNGGNDNIEVELIIGALPDTIRANVGGRKYIDSRGNVWLSDRPYHPGAWGHVRGHLYNVSDNILNTEDDKLYQTELFWLDDYKFDLPNGNYTVILYFAELYYNYAGGRVFDVYIENKLVLSQFDIFSTAGFQTATSRFFSGIQVTDGQLDVHFKHIKAHAKLSAIEVIRENVDHPLLAISSSQLDFGRDKTSLSLKIINYGKSRLTWVEKEDVKKDWIVSIYPESGSLAEGESAIVNVKINRTGLADGVYTGSLLINSNGGIRKINLSVFVGKIKALYRVNAGGDENYIDNNGNIWEKDKLFSSGSWGYIGGHSYSTSRNIDNTDNDILYQSEHWGMSAYRFSVPNGTYYVALHFAEIYYHAIHKRIFNVKIEGANVISDYDIYAEVGNYKATTKMFKTVVKDNIIDIVFSANIDEAKISAIEILAIQNEPSLSLSPTSLDFGPAINLKKFTIKNIGAKILNWSASLNMSNPCKISINPSFGSLNPGDSCQVVLTIDRTMLNPGNYSGDIHIISSEGDQDVRISIIEGQESQYIKRINVGGNSYTDHQGVVWSADQEYKPGGWGYVGGYNFSISDPISNTEDDKLYQTERFAIQDYRIDVPNGNYDITFYFAEIYYNYIGGRVFSIYIEKKLVLKDYDIYANVGFRNATSKCFRSIHVIDGRIDISFTQKAAHAKLSAIEIRSSGSQKPVISITPTTLDFGSSMKELNFTVKNIGGNTLSWHAEKSSGENWITLINPNNGVLNSGESKTVTIRVNRKGIAIGAYSGTVSITSNAGDQKIFLKMIISDLSTYVRRINCGSGSSYIDKNNNVWEADKIYHTGGWGYVSGHAYNTKDPIENTNNDPLYQSERWANSLKYCFDVENGSYYVILHFAEIYYNNPNKRIFSVFIEDSLVMSNYDIYSDVGHDVATQKSFKISVKDGQLDIRMISTKDAAKISAIEIIGLSRDPILSVSPRVLDFGKSRNAMTFSIKNSGGKILHWKISKKTKLPWIADINPDSGNISVGYAQQVSVIVDRSNISNGNSNGIIKVNSNVGEQTIFINIMTPKNILYVRNPINNPNAWKGRSPLFNSITDAINSASNNDQIWVAKGHYSENISLINGIGIYGGFDGNESSIEERGEILDDTSWTTIDGRNNGRCILAASNNVIDGFELINGKEVWGAGIGISNATNIKILNILIHSCSVSWGGSGILIDAPDQGGSIKKKKVIIWNCQSKCGTLEITTKTNASVKIKSCTIVKNNGYGLEISDGGGKVPENINHYFSNCIIWGNNNSVNPNPFPDVVAWARDYTDYSYIGNSPWPETKDKWGSPLPHNIFGNSVGGPGFVNSDNNFHLIPNSPCVKAGKDAENMGAYVNIKQNPQRPLISIKPLFINFGSKDTLKTFVIKNIGNDTLRWNITKIIEPWIVSLSPSNGILISNKSDTIRVKVRRTMLMEGNYTGSIGVASNDKHITIEAKISVSSRTLYLKRVNCGSNSNYIDTKGHTWLADQAYSPGSWGFVNGHHWHTDHKIEGTEDEVLYQSERYGMSCYKFDVPNGIYRVRLKFAEIYWNKAKRRVFGVNIEGNPVIQNLDIWSKVKEYAALDTSYGITSAGILVTDGQLNINFLSSVDNAKISAIEIAYDTAIDTCKNIYVNCGGSAYVDKIGRLWNADFGYDKGNTYSVTSAISGTSDDYLYQTERWENNGMNYVFPVQNGTYLVTLHFAEIYFKSSKKRKFDVKLEGTQVLKNFDIFDQAGANMAIKKTFKVNVFDNNIKIAFISVIEAPKISAIEIIPLIMAKKENKTKELLSNAFPDDYNIYQNYPNPFNPDTWIPYKLANHAEVNILIYNLMGRKIKDLANHIEKEKGSYLAHWNGLNNDGEKVSSGIYFCRFYIKPFSGGSKPIIKSIKMTIEK